MRKVGRIMYAKSKSRKFDGKCILGKCEYCGKEIKSCNAYQHVDGNNISITNNSPYLCKDCFEKRYNEHIKTEVEVFKDKLFRQFRYLKSETKDENEKNLIDKLVKIISLE